MPQSIIGIGETVLDIVFKENQPQAAVPGGSTFNAMISLGRTAGRQNPDLKLLMITQIGDDAVADIVPKESAAFRDKAMFRWPCSTSKTTPTTSFSGIPPRSPSRCPRWR